MRPHLAKHDIFLDLSRTRVVCGGHPDAKFLVARKGQEVTEDIAARHGIVEGTVVDDAQPGATVPDMSVPRTNVVPEGRGPGRPRKNDP